MGWCEYHDMDFDHCICTNYIDSNTIVKEILVLIEKYNIHTVNRMEESKKKINELQIEMNSLKE